jgi:hypothetical protein
MPKTLFAFLLLTITHSLEVTVTSEDMGSQLCDGSAT